MLFKRSLDDSCRMGRRIVVMKLVCSFGHCECDGHKVHKLGQRRLTADLLAPKTATQYTSSVNGVSLPTD